MTHDRRTQPPRRAPLAAAIERNDWELAALLLLDALATVTRRLPPGTIDDVLALVSDEEARDDARH